MRHVFVMTVLLSVFGLPGLAAEDTDRDCGRLMMWAESDIRSAILSLEDGEADIAYHLVRQGTSRFARGIRCYGECLTSSPAAAPCRDHLQNASDAIRAAANSFGARAYGDAAHWLGEALGGIHEVLICIPEVCSD